jgi:protein MpaA
MLFCAISVFGPLTGAFSEEPGHKSNKEFCDEVNKKFRGFGWNRIICNPDRWDVFDYSKGGNPLFYQEFGFENPKKEIPVNLVLCGVHGDEPSSVYQCFHLVRTIMFDDPGADKDFKLVVAPLVNPDGFFLNTRQNGSGIDPNRNLPTKDWHERARSVWKRYKEDPRKNPGKKPGSAVESRLQAFLIDRYQPDKIFSFHAPLGFLDFDGPGDRKYYNLVRVEQRARQVGLSMEVDTNKLLKLVDYRFFPGSLGNYAGNERKIPTYTVELPTASAAKAHSYWTIVRFALLNAFRYQVYDREERNPIFDVRNSLSRNPGEGQKPLNTFYPAVTSSKGKAVHLEHES